MATQTQQLYNGAAETPPRHAVSLVATVKNEADNIAALLDSMLAQTQQPDEIVINDNWSSDGTAAIVEAYQAAGWPIRLVRGGHNIASGRNNAIAHAHGPLIACCDAGLRLPPTWLAAIVRPLEHNSADVVAGFYVPDARSTWELALGATNYPDAGEIDSASFLPAGQSVAFRKAAWQAAGGYPEWAATCEDLLFDLELKRLGFRFVFEPAAAVLFRPRATPRAYWRQYFSYARGDGIADLFRRRHALRYAVYGGVVAVAALATRFRAAPLLLLPGGVLYLRRPYQRLMRRSKHLPLAVRVRALALLPLQRLLGDLAKMAGYPWGLWLRFSGRAGPQAAAHRATQSALAAGTLRV